MNNNKTMKFLCVCVVGGGGGLAGKWQCMSNGCFSQ